MGTVSKYVRKKKKGGVAGSEARAFVAELTQVRAVLEAGCSQVRTTAATAAATTAQCVHATQRAFARAGGALAASLVCSQPAFETCCVPDVADVPADNGAQFPPPAVAAQSPMPTDRSEEKKSVSGGSDSSTEAAFRAWANVQHTPILRAWSRCLVASLLVSATRAAMAGGWPGLCQALPSWLMGIPYSVAACYTTPARVHALVVFILFGRFLMTTCIGAGWVPMPHSFLIISSLRMEVLLEVLVSGIMEQTRIPTLFIGRVALVLGYCHLYRAWGFPRALMQAAALQVASFAVSVATDLSYRRLYANRSDRAPPIEVEGVVHRPHASQCM